MTPDKNRILLYAEIKKNPAWAPHASDVFMFREYLRNTENLSILVHGEQNAEGGMDDITHKIPYVHRWTDKYRRSVLAKFYKLEQFLSENPSPVTMITLTTYHGWNQFRQESELSIEKYGHLVTIEQSFALLKDGWKKFGKRLKNRSFVWVMEPHQTGYPHYHIIVLGTFTEHEKRELTDLWANKYGISDDEVGIEFTEPPIKSIRNYLMKYMVKGFRKSGTKYKKNEEWDIGQIVFNALVKKNRWRLFGSSKDLVEVMKYDKKTDASIKYYATELCHKDGTKNTRWLRTEKTGWKNHEQVYREITVCDVEERDL